MSEFEIDRPLEAKYGAQQANPSGFSAGDFLQLVKSRWLMIGVMTTCFLGLGLVDYLLTPKLYRASSMLQIEQRSMPTMASGQRNPWLDAWANVKYYPTQYRLLKSRGLAERVVKHLQISESLADPSSADPLGSELEIGSSEPLSPTGLASSASRLSAGLAVDPIAGTELVRLSYVAPDPQQAAKIANAYADVFIQWESETRSRNVGRLSEVLTSQIEALRLEIESREVQLQEAGRDTGFVGVDPEGAVSTLTNRRVDELSGAYSAAVAERLEKQAAYRELQSLSDQDAAERADAATPAAIRTELARLRQEYETGLTTYKPEWPAMVELRSRITETEQRLARAYREGADTARRQALAEYQSAQRRERTLLDELEKERARAIDESPTTLNLNSLQTEIETLRELRDLLVRQASETGVSANLSDRGGSHIHVIDRALPPTSAFRPSLRNDLVAAGGAGLFLSVGLVILIYFLDRSVKSAEELEGLLGLPVLGVIPDLSASRSYGYSAYGVYGYGARRKRKQMGDSEREDDPAAEVEIELLPIQRPRLAASEAYRSLRTALLLSSADELQVIGITSAEAGEGKTATAVNLATVLAQLNRRVLLVDGDLRKPRLHKVLKVSNRQGLVNYLTGSAELDGLFQSLSEPPLTFCAAGPHPPNPSELLASDRMADFLEKARQRFDIVIVDSPPVLAVTDAIVSGSLTDGVVLCFRANKVLREDVLACRDRLRLADVRILGAVLNRYQARAGSGKRYRYYEAYAEDTAQVDSAA